MLPQQKENLEFCCLMARYFRPKKENRVKAYLPDPGRSFLDGFAQVRNVPELERSDP